MTEQEMNHVKEFFFNEPILVYKETVYEIRDFDIYDLYKINCLCCLTLTSLNSCKMRHKSFILSSQDSFFPIGAGLEDFGISLENVINFVYIIEKNNTPVIFVE